MPPHITVLSELGMQQAPTARIASHHALPPPPVRLADIEPAFPRPAEHPGPYASFSTIDEPLAALSMTAAAGGPAGAGCFSWAGAGPGRGAGPAGAPQKPERCRRCAPRAHAPCLSADTPLPSPAVRAQPPAPRAGRAR
jgi:hypothetical protein